MRHPTLIAALAMLAASCATPRPAERPPPAAPPAAAPLGLVLPERIVIPASYRLVLLEGQLTLVRETDAEALHGAPASLRIIEGEIARGELAYQPGLLPQELAAEVAQSRESTERMENALGEVMRRSRELSLEAEALQQEARRIEAVLASSRAEATGGTPSSAPPPGPRSQ